MPDAAVLAGFPVIHRTKIVQTRNADAGFSDRFPSCSAVKIHGSRAQNAAAKPRSLVPIRPFRTSFFTCSRSLEAPEYARKLLRRSLKEMVSLLLVWVAARIFVVVGCSRFFCRSLFPLPSVPSPVPPNHPQPTQSPLTLPTNPQKRSIPCPKTHLTCKPRRPSPPCDNFQTDSKGERGELFQRRPTPEVRSQGCGCLLFRNRFQCS